METVQIVQAHFEQYWVAYALGALCVFPILYVFRRYTAPVIFYCLEYSIYLIMMHVGLYTLVQVARWFKENSSMRAVRVDAAEPPTWGTPLIEFWDKSAYDPAWVFNLEIFFAVAIFIAMYRIRPMRPQKKRDRRPPSQKVAIDYSRRRYAPPTPGKR